MKRENKIKSTINDLDIHSVLVLFIKKKDGLLRLCINFHGLNHISKKDCYPLLLISNLLDLPRKA